MEIIVRPVGDADVPRMAAIRAQTSGDASFWADRISAYLSGKHSPQKALGERASFLALESSMLVGFVAGHRSKRFGCDGELQWIDVKEDRRGRGIAAKLIASMGEWFLQKNLLRICVNVGGDNIQAQTVYAKHGARRLNEHWMLWEDARRML